MNIGFGSSQRVEERKKKKEGTYTASEILTESRIQDDRLNILMCAYTAELCETIVRS